MPFLYIVIPVLVLFMAGLVAFAVLLNRKEEQRKRALAVIRGQSFETGTKRNETDIRDKRRADLAKKLRDSGRQSANRRKNRKNSISDLILQTGISGLTFGKYWAFSFFLCALCAVGAKLSGLAPFVVLMCGIAGLFGIPRLILKFIGKRRQKKFLKEFADALDAMVRLLKAGMPVGEAISMVAREYDGPVGEEMARIYDSQKIGVPLPEAVSEAAERMPLPEMRMFATGVSIQQQTGSSLSEILSNLSGVIRARYQLKRKVAALSSEALASALIIGCLPLVVGGGLYIINREYIEVLFIDPFGRLLLSGAVFWMLIGAFIMRQMINFKV